MNSVVLSKTYLAPPVCEKEILRYAGCKDADSTTLKLLQECVDIALQRAVYRVCYRQLDIKINDDVCDFGAFSFKSKNLAKNLDGCEKAVVFGATVGIEFDRLIAKYSHIAPSKALMLQAFGAERIEALCDTFCKDIAEQYGTNVKPRFSAGYGDLPLSCQNEIFSVLECEKRIGLTLNSSMIMSPSKSVTAIIGLGGEPADKDKCGICNIKNCTMKGTI